MSYVYLIRETGWHRQV